MELTKSELSILEILINEQEPLAKTDILSKAPEIKSWKDGSIHILLNGLLNKGAICEAGYVRTGKGYGRTFAPTKDGEAYFSNLLVDLTRKTKFSEVLSRLVESNALTEEELTELEQIINSRKR